MATGAGKTHTAVTAPGLPGLLGKRGPIGVAIPLPLARAWRRVIRRQLVRAVVVRSPGDAKIRAFFSTDPTMLVPEILTAYA